MKCPSCGSEDCQFVTTAETKNKYFDAGDACCGLFLLGPAGLLCGLCGSESSTQTKEFWICHDCGRKFSGLESIKAKTEGEEVKLRFYSEITSEDYKKNDLAWKRIQDGYIKYIRYKELDSSIFWKTPDIKKDEYKSLKENFRIYGNKEHLIYFVVLEDNGIVFTQQGLFVGEHYIPNIEQIVLYRNIVYVNQTNIRFSNKEAARGFFEFLKCLFPGEVNYECENYKKVVGYLQRVTPEKNDNQSHFSSQPEYKHYIYTLTEEYFGLVKNLDPKSYNIYTEGDKKRKKQAKYMLIGIGIIFILLTVMATLMTGIICGIILMIARSAYLSRNSCLEYKNALPEELLALIEEKESSSLCKKGTISPEYYEEHMEKYKKAHSRLGKYCKRCGKELQAQWTACPYCGSDVV